MSVRMQNPVMLVPGALQAAVALGDAVKQTGLPATTRALVHLRASQINGCSYCVDMAGRELREAGETDARIVAVSAWRDTSWFTEAERAALALTEAATRLSDRSGAVPDDVWEEAARQYDQPALAAVLLQVAVSNFWNHLNVPIRQGPMPAAR